MIATIELLSIHRRFDGGLHLEEPPSPMGEAFDGGLHFDDPPSPITAMVAISSGTQ